MRRDGFGVRVRLAGEDDYAALGPVFAEVERYHREALPHIFRRPPEGTFPPFSLFRHWITEEGSAMFVADVADDVGGAGGAGDLVGFVSVRTDSRPAEGILQSRTIAVVDTLAVRSDRRRCGVGRALMAAAHGWAQERRLGYVSLNVWEFNEPGLGFYAALGYRTMSRHMECALPVPPPQT